MTVIDDVKDKYKEMHLFLIQCLSGGVLPLDKVEKDENYFGAYRWYAYW